jgi:hypothetical protein
MATNQFSVSTLFEHGQIAISPAKKFRELNIMSAPELAAAQKCF